MALLPLRGVKAKKHVRKLSIRDGIGPPSRSLKVALSHAGASEVSEVTLAR